ncbi:MAG TPA: hypothetical protein VHU17_15345 [Acidimicrobiales bacterium]|nr:hypothetical protein [Acidimicrobiales bacterium]
MSSSVVPVGGSNLAAVVINPTDQKLRYGVAGAFERWSGASWEPAGAWTISLASWGGFGTIVQGEARVKMIGRGSPARGLGSVEYFSLPPLPTGWYRVRRHQAWGAVEVVDGAPEPPTLDEQSGTRGSVTVRPPLFPPAGGVAHLSGQAPRRYGLTTIDDDRPFYRGFEGPVTLERWQSDGWHTVSTLQTEDPLEPSGHEGNVMVVIPELPVGTYRLVRHHRSVGDLYRVIWITAALTGIE